MLVFLDKLLELFSFSRFEFLYIWVGLFYSRVNGLGVFSYRKRFSRNSFKVYSILIRFLLFIKE